MLVVAGHVPSVLTLPFNVAETSNTAVAPPPEVTACAIDALPVPVYAVEGELLPDVALATVMVAFLVPVAEGVNVTT